jgi:hypothetical protein
MFILGILIGYCICVLVPMPGLSRFVLDGWAALWAKLKG